MNEPLDKTRKQYLELRKVIDGMLECISNAEETKYTRYIKKQVHIIEEDTHYMFENDHDSDEESKSDKVRIGGEDWDDYDHITGASPRWIVMNSSPEIEWTASDFD